LLVLRMEWNRCEHQPRISNAHREGRTSVLQMF
jgi:hypothetical protein